MRKNGIHNFTFNIIEEWNDNEIDDAEIFWIDYFRSWDIIFGYNLEKGGCKNKIISESTKLKHSKLSKARYNNETTIRLRKAKGTALAKLNASNASIGSKNARAKLTENQVLEIRKLYANKLYNQLELAILFNIPTPTINHIIKRYTWKHI